MKNSKVPNSSTNLQNIIKKMTLTRNTSKTRNHLQIQTNEILEKEIKSLGKILKKLSADVEKFLIGKKRKKMPESALINRFESINLDSSLSFAHFLRKCNDQLTIFETNRLFYHEKVYLEVICRLEELESTINSASYRIKKIKQHLASQKPIKDNLEDIKNFDNAVDSYNHALFKGMETKDGVLYIIERFLLLTWQYHGRISNLEEKIHFDWKTQVFGVSLTELKQRSGLNLSHVLVKVCNQLEIDDVTAVKGIFRLNGSDAKSKLYRLQLNCGLFGGLQNGYDIHSLASTLKAYLHELPESLLDYSLCEDYKAFAEIEDKSIKKTNIIEILTASPEILLDNLIFLLGFLHKIVKNSEENRMTVHNLAIILNPGLFHANTKDNSVSHYDFVGIHVIEFLLHNFKKIKKTDLLVNSIKRISHELALI